MDSRKILEIYKLINDRSIKPVGAWPTIADIPQGAIVLDVGGVVKQKWVNELLTMAETAIMLVHNGEPVTQNGDVILVDDPTIMLSLIDDSFIEILDDGMLKQI